MSAQLPPEETHAQVTPEWIGSAVRLTVVLEALDAAGDVDVPLDTEADSFHHYFEKVCLLQVAVSGRVFLVDPLAVDLAPLLSRLAARRLLMHGADYDLRLLLRGYGFRAGRIFDTMLAAQLAGEKEIGLAAQLAKRVGVTLDKAHQRADWSERPLGPELLAYASSDVLHLPALVKSLTADLDAKGRLPWLLEECARLVAAPMTAREDDPENDWRLKGTNAMSDRERAVVRALWHVREEKAQEADRPAFRILTNERLMSAARIAATGERDLTRLFPGSRPLPSGLARAFHEAIGGALALPAERCPARRRGERNEVDPAVEKVVEKLKRRRDQTAQALALDPAVVASRAVLTAAAKIFVRNGSISTSALVSEAGISRWRAELLAG